MNIWEELHGTTKPCRTWFSHSRNKHARKRDIGARLDHAVASRCLLTQTSNVHVTGMRVLRIGTSDHVPILLQLAASGQSSTSLAAPAIAKRARPPSASLVSGTVTITNQRNGEKYHISPFLCPIVHAKVDNELIPVAISTRSEITIINPQIILRQTPSCTPARWKLVTPLGKCKATCRISKLLPALLQ